MFIYSMHYMCIYIYMYIYIYIYIYIYTCIGHTFHFHGCLGGARKPWSQGSLWTWRRGAHVRKSYMHENHIPLSHATGSVFFVDSSWLRSILDAVAISVSFSIPHPLLGLLPVYFRALADKCTRGQMTQASGRGCRTSHTIRTFSQSGVLSPARGAVLSLMTRPPGDHSAMRLLA